MKVLPDFHCCSLPVILLFSIKLPAANLMSSDCAGTTLPCGIDLPSPSLLWLLVTAILFIHLAILILSD